MDDDEEEDDEHPRKKKHYLKQRYSLQKVFVDGSNSHHLHALSHSKSSIRERSNQNDSRRAYFTENVTGLERVSGACADTNKVSDHSKPTKPSTPSKYALFLEDAPFLEVLDLMKAHMKICIDKQETLFKHKVL